MPDAIHVRLETWAFEPAQSAFTINLRARPATARCPLCGKRSKRVHSRYQRTLADLPWGEHAATVLLGSEGPSLRKRTVRNENTGEILPMSSKKA